jgi:hypothetical protein
MTEMSTSEQGVRSRERPGKSLPFAASLHGRKGVLPARANREGSRGITFLSAASFLAIHPQGGLEMTGGADVLYSTYLARL